VRRFNIIILATLVAALVPALAMASVSGSLHDMTAYSGTGTTVAAQLCQACHTPHNAGTDVLWAQAVTVVGGFSDVQNLCYTCHDGSITGSGSDTAFDPGTEQHTTLGSDCSGGDDSCHDVHGSGAKFLTEVPDANGIFCTACHGATTTGSYPGGNHLAGAQHYTSGTDFTCNSCHAVHGAVAQTAGYQTVTGVAKPILRADNYVGAKYGTMCNACHTKTAPFDVATYGALVTDPFDYDETTYDGTETKHPTYTVGAGDTWDDMTGCNTCHDVHNSAGLAAGATGAGTGMGSFLIPANDNSAYCMSCHDGGTGPDYDGGGGGSHFIGDTVNGTPSTDPFTKPGAASALPWSNQLNDDGNAAVPDFTGNTDNFMTCETCHSVHRNGVTGTNYFLRIANTADNEICSACHTAN
jgi:predicted CXXCH cytochrome family protein